jgi:hypothetical protein
MSGNSIVLADLKRSSLLPEDLDPMGIGLPERSALDIPVGIPGYLIPYYDIEGLPTTFYRARLFDFAQKYLQPRGSQNQVYFPKRFKAVLNGHPYLLITEGEKKAAAATAAGIPAVALGGVYSWRNRTLSLPSNAVVSQGGKVRKGGAPVDLAVASANRLQIKLPPEFDPDRLVSEYATGFEQLVNFIKERGLSAIIVFDSNINGRLDVDIQKAASRLALELRFMGVPFHNIKGLILPNPEQALDKVGIDDYITATSPLHLSRLIDGALAGNTFPSHPNMHMFVSKKLANSKMPRKDMSLLGLSIIADLDANGRRLRSKDGLMHYFNRRNKRLVRATTPTHRGPVLLADEFSSMLYNEYSITGNDHRLQRQIATQFTAESPIEEVIPQRNLITQGDSICFQVSNSQFASCSATSPMQLHDNGDLGVLFQSEQGSPLDLAKLALMVDKELQAFNSTGKLPPLWYNTLLQTRIKGLPEDTKQAQLLAILYMVSPWLFRWRGTQLPIELMIGEAGSGKSTIYVLRQSILQGFPDLKNQPNSMRDWQASVVNAGGLHVIDNLNLDHDRAMRQSLSDEMCRIITEPSPTLEIRKYYTEFDLAKIPVNVTFALTAVKMPFIQTDIIQRAITTELDKGSEQARYDNAWAPNQLAQHGGREGWLAHHLVALHLFFRLAAKRWDHRYVADYRLVNLEQAMHLMGALFGWETKWLGPYLNAGVSKTSVSADWVLEGIKAYVEHVRASFYNRGNLEGLKGVSISAGDIATWAISNDDYSHCVPLCDPRKLGRYMSQHKSLIGQVAGLQEGGARQNRVIYKIKG